MPVRRKRLEPFLGIATTRGEDAPLPYAMDLLNVRVDDGKVRPRWGYGILSERDDHSANVYGLAYLNGYDDDYAPKDEFVLIEERDGRVAPYSVDPVTGVRTEIGTGLSLAASAWRAVAYGGTSYWINPDSAASVYKHDVDDATSWSPLETLPDALPLAPISISKGIPPYIPLDISDDATSFVATTGHSSGSIASPIYNSAKQPQWETRGSNVNSWTQIELTFDTAFGLEGTDALMYRVVAGRIDEAVNDGFNSEAANHYVQLVNSSGVASSAVPSKIDGTLDAPRGDLYGWVDLTAFTGAQLADIKKIRIRFGSRLFNNASFYRLVELKPGGILYTDLGGLKLDGDLSGVPPLEYAYNYTKATETSGAEYGIPQVPSQHIGVSTFGKLPPGGSQYTVRVDPTEDPLFAGGTTNLYRKVDGSWRRIAQGSSDLVLSFADDLKDTVIVADPVAYPVSTLEASGGTFDGRGVIGAFAMLSWVCWLYPGGIRNVRHSYIGDPERQAGEFDEEDNANRGATFALADDRSDEPVAGVAIGNAAVIFGTKGVHVQAGNSPSALTPPRRIVGAPPIANADAFAPLTLDGVPGVAYADATLEAVWWIGQQQLFDQDGSARPVELTADQRGLLREWLEDPAKVRLASDEATGALWCVAEDRALRLTPTNPIDGRRQWVKHLYFLPDATVDTVTPESATRLPDAAVGTNRTGHNVAWSNLNGCLGEGGGATNGTLVEGSVTRWLDVSGFTASLPVGAVVTGIRAKVRRRTVPSVAGTSVRALEDYAGVLVSGVLVGADKSSLVQLPETEWGWQTYEWTVAELGGFTAASIPNVALRFGWRADVPTGTGTPANWSVAVSPTSPQNYGTEGTETTEFTVSPTWIGAGSAPPWAKVRLTATAWAGTSTTPPAIAEFTGIASADNGLGASGSGAIAIPTPALGASYIQAGPTNASFRIGTGSAKVHTITTMVDLYTAGAGTGPLHTHTLTTLIQTPDSSTLEIDAVVLEVLYTVEAQVEVAQGWERLAFTPGRVLAAATNAGRIDRLEWDGSAYYAGEDRDGGLPMPEGYWHSGVMRGANRRLTHVEMDGDAASVTAWADEAPLAGVTRTFSDRTERFPMACRGWNHRIGVEVGETTDGVAGMTLRTHDLGERLDK